MKGSVRLVAFVVTLVVLATFQASGAPAQMTKAEANCRKAILKGVSKYVRTATKAIVSCHKRRDAGILLASTDCNDLTVADGAAKLSIAASKFHASVGGASDRCVGLTNVLALYPECKSPAEGADDGGATTGIDDFNEVAACEIGLAHELVEATARQTLGNPDPSAMGAAAVGCHAAIARGMDLVLKAFLKARGKCQGTLDKAAGPLDYACGQSDPGAKIAAAKSILDAAIASECAATLAAIDAVDSCGDDVSQLQYCVTDNVTTKIGSGLVAMVYGLSTCPRGVDITLRAGNASMITDTEMDLGYSGFAHDQDTPDLAKIAVLLDCNSTCSACSVALDPKETVGAGNCRCAADPTTRCSTINGNDAACPAAGACECFFFPPHPINAAGSPLCLVQEMNSDFAGIVNVGAGSSSTNVDLSTRVYLGIAQDQPCPTCVGDTTENDGVAAGTCSGGSRNGLACDANATHCTFGTVSYECPPTPGSNVSGVGLQIDFAPLTDGAVSLSTPTCGGPTDSCAGSCIPDVGNDYACDASNAPDQYCDGAMTCAGQGYLPCTTTADCAPLSAGTCSASDTRDCPSDPLTAAGASASGPPTGPFYGDLVSTFCMPSSAGSLNATIGLPGPGRVKYDMEYEPRCGVCSLAATVACSTNAECTVGQGVCIPEPTLMWVPPGMCI